MQESAFLGRVAQYGSKLSGGDFGKSHSYRHYGECEEPSLLGQNMKDVPPFLRQARPSGPASRKSQPQVAGTVQLYHLQPLGSL